MGPPLEYSKVEGWNYLEIDTGCHQVTSLLPGLSPSNLSANRKAAQHWGLSPSFGPDKTECESWFYSLVALDKEFWTKGFHVLTPRMKAIKPISCSVPAEEFNNIRKVPISVLAHLWHPGRSQEVNFNDGV